MTQLHTSPAAGLQWVRVEIEQSLTRARGLIEQYLDSPENLQPLQQAAIELHLVNGSAGIVQCYGIVALSEEMAQLLQTLQQGKVVERDAAFSALLGATLQLSDYVDVLADSRVECALALLPVINELRLAQGKGVRSEAELVAAELLFLGVRPDPPAMHVADGSVLATARQMLPLYQASLLRWLKLNDNQALLKIGKIAAQISKESSIAVVHELWRGAAACAEAVLTRTLDDSQDIRRLYGRVMQQLQLLATSGEDAAAEKSGDLVYHFVFHLGRSHANSPRANAIREDYAVARLVPSREFVEEFRRRLRGPNTLLLNRLAAEIRQDLNQAKDRIDLVVRTGSRDSAALLAITTGLTRVANTLSVLGLSNLQHVVGTQIQSLQALAAESAPASRWMEVAVALLRIEQGLEVALYRQLRQQVAAGQGVEEPAAQAADLQESVAALLREALIDLARLKAAVDGYLRGASPESLSEASRSLGQIASSLRVLEDARAAELAGQLLDSMSGPSFPDRCRDPEWAASFADAVILVEIYLEALRDRRPDSPDILQSLAQRIAALQAPEPSAQRAAATAEPLAAAPQVVDEEIRDIFLEEGAEVRASLITRLPALRRDSQDRGNLQEIRRGFHTLKGSGRMVGATDIGEFAWAVEGLLNRCLDGSIQVSPPVVDAIDEAVSALEPMLHSFAAGAAASPKAKALIDRVQHLASGKLLDTQAETELLAVFREDANERLEEIRGWLGRQADTASEYEVNEVVRRAFHTLRGSAAIVGLKPVSQLAGNIEAYMDALRSGALKLPSAALVLLREACDAIAAWVDSASVDADIAPWLLRIQQLQKVVPQEAQLAAAEHGLADVFASEALDLLQSIESGIRDWARTPENHELPRKLKRIYQTLHGAALMANCAALASPARTFEQVVGELADAGTIPDALFFTRLSALQEKLYQQLDQFRDGVLTGAGAELAQEAAALRAPAPMAPSHLPVHPPEHAPPATPFRAAPEAAEPALPVAPEEFAESGSADAELQSVFLAEADEILQAMDREADAWERAPESAGPLAVLKRAAHTLKGSSRMAGIVGIDLVSQRLERLFDEIASGDIAVNVQMFARLRNATDGLYRMIEAIRRGGVPDAGPVLAELEGPQPVSETLLTPEAFEAPAPAPAVERVREQPEEEDEGELKAFDPEMAEIFSAEAAELLEQLETQLAAWQANPANQAAVLEVQRALHTLKGGARMGGLRAMGSAAHDMETHVNALESGRLPSDQTAFAKLRAELEMLQRMHDALRRGETTQLLEPAAVETPIVELPVIPPPPPEVVEPAAIEVPVAAIAGANPWAPLLFWRPDDDHVGAAALRRETARVPVEQLESMLNQAGEISIYRSRLEQQTTELSRSLKEVEETIARIRDQLRGLNIETEAQIAARGLIDAQAPDRYSGDFDPLEMDRFTRMQELSRAIAESVGDLTSLHEAMNQGMGVSETLLLQQGRVNTGVQQGLMGTLMVPFSRQVQRLQRLVRQVAQENGKQADIQFTGIEAELDRNVLERMTAPLEHLLRNAVVHGIETPEQRRSLGKPEAGEIRLSLAREGTQLMMELADDGHGLDFDAIRGVAIERGLIAADAQVSDDDAAQLIFQAGFSTARQLTQDAGRGIGMDVVASEVKQLGGTLELRSELGRGMRLIIRLPLTLALSQALMVSVGNEMYAIPLSSIEGIVRVPVKQLAEHYADEDGAPLAYGNQSYRVRYLGDYLGVARHEVSERAVGAILVRVTEGLGGQERRVAVVVDVLHGNREIVSKSAGPQISAISGLSGATILPDGRVVLILDVPELVHERARRAAVIATRPVADQRELILVVDDSITMRRVAERVLGKNGYRIATAKDGLDAMAWLQNESPAAILLDIEMPRADGFEVAAFVRKNERIKHVPIIMITSRSGEKHRERARSLGVDRYVIKPYQEEQLMTEIRSVLGGSTAVSGQVH